MFKQASPTVSVEMVENNGQIGYRVTVSYNGETVTFFHEGRDQKAAEMEGRKQAMHMKYGGTK